MPAERFFLDDILTLHELYELKGPEFHHLAHVMRARKGDSIELINGKGALAQATVHDLKKETACVRVNEIQQAALPSPYCLTLAQALPKSSRLDLILEKGTELGVNSFWIFPGDRSATKDLYSSKIDRAQTVMIAAMKQCGRLYLPSLLFVPPIHQWEDMTHTPAFFGDLSPQAPLFETTWKRSHLASSSILFITGPEGGFSEKELASLRDKGATGVKLHPNILRTETASLMALSLLSHWILN